MQGRGGLMARVEVGPAGAEDAIQLAQVEHLVGDEHERALGGLCPAPDPAPAAGVQQGVDVRVGVATGPRVGPREHPAADVRHHAELWVHTQEGAPDSTPDRRSLQSCGQPTRERA